MFEGIALGQVEKQVNEFMLTTTRIYNVKHTVITEEDGFVYHYMMVSYEP